MKKIQKHQIVTSLLAVYALFMTLYFGLDLLKQGHVLRFWVTFSVEIVVITLSFFALKKRDQYRAQRKQELKEKLQEP